MYVSRCNKCMYLDARKVWRVMSKVSRRSLLKVKQWKTMGWEIKGNDSTITGTITISGTSNINQYQDNYQRQKITNKRAWIQERKLLNIWSQNCKSNWERLEYIKLLCFWQLNLFWHDRSWLEKAKVHVEHWTGNFMAHHKI